MIQAVIKELKNYIKPGYEEFISKSNPGMGKSLGVPMGPIRQIAKRISKTDDWNKILSEKSQIYEIRMIQGLVIAYRSNENPNVIMKYLKKFVTDIDNWALCDSTSMSLEIVKKHQEEFWIFLQQFFNSDKEFEMRFAFIVSLRYFITPNYIEKVIDKIENNKSDFYYVKMAKAWLIAEIETKMPGIGIKILEQKLCDKWTHNKAIRKMIESYRISEKTKEYARSLKC